MPSANELITQLNAAARRAGVADSILQFDNIATHAQYSVPYTVTSRFVKAGDEILDWGCGNGHFSLLLESLGARVTGYSFEPPPRAMRSSTNFQFVAGSDADPRTLPFPDQSFDVITGVGVLEHVWETGGDEPSSLTELARVLRPGGVLLTFHLPNVGGWIERVVYALRLNKHFHQRKFGEAEIRALWAQAGLAVEELGLYNALPRAELSKLPAAMKHNGMFARLYDGIDAAITRVAPGICTNFYIVGRKSLRNG